MKARAKGHWLAGFLAVLSGVLLMAGAPAVAQNVTDGPDKVVYHFVDGLAQASRGLEYIRNHLEANPKARITVVAHAAGVDFLMRGAKTAKGNEYRSIVEDLELSGVTFRVCDITLRERNLGRDRFIKEATFVPSGVAEITRLQQREGYAYLRP